MASLVHFLAIVKGKVIKNGYLSMSQVCLVLWVYILSGIAEWYSSVSSFGRTTILISTVAVAVSVNAGSV